LTKPQSVTVYLLIIYHTFSGFFATCPPFPLHTILTFLTPTIFQNLGNILVETSAVISLILIALHLLAGYWILNPNKWGWFVSIFLTVFWIITSTTATVLLLPNLDFLTLSWMILNSVTLITLYSLKTHFTKHV
jgi:hypothetical protein